MKLAVFDNLAEGGAKRVVFEQIKGLSQKHTVTYYTNTDKSSFPFERFAKVKHYDLRLSHHAGLLRPLRELSLFTLLLKTYGKIARDIRAGGAEAVLVHPCRITQAPFLLSLLSLPTIYYAEEWLRIYYERKQSESLGFISTVYENVRLKILSWIDLVNMRAATRILSNSKFTRKNLRSLGLEQIQVLYPGVDTQLFKPLKQDKEGHFFLFIGSKSSGDGYPLVEEAIALSSQMLKVTFVFFDGQSFRLTDRELLDLYQQATATLCLAEHEPFGLSAVESMATGTPVIAVNEGGYQETVVESKTGLLIERDAESLYNAMKRMAVDKEAREAMGKHARKRVSDYFTWKQHLYSLNKILKELEDEAHNTS
jgi:glycosyltransferase involved in cell wall biosynthesis